MSQKSKQLMEDNAEKNPNSKRERTRVVEEVTMTYQGPVMPPHLLG